MNILYLISYAGKAGTEKYVADLMRLCTAQGHTCHLVYCEGGELSAAAEKAGYAVLRLDMRPRRVVSAARQLARYCREKQIDVIHAQYPRENVIAVLSRLWRRSTRVVFTSHLTVQQGLAWRVMNRLITPRDAAVISVCGAGAGLLRRNGVKSERIRVIHNGVEPRAAQPRLNAIREEFSLSPETFVFLTMARYAPEKGLGFLLDSLAALKKKTQRPFVCLIAGDGAEFAEIGAEIRALGLEKEVIQAGYRQDTDALLRSADAYVSSALYNEAMSFAILEAMENSLPLAVTDVGAGRELSEGCGFCVQPGDVTAMTEALYALREDDALCRRLGGKARERAVNEFDLNRLAAQVMEVYAG